MPKTTNIIIVGAGFGGLSLALGLEKRFKKDRSISITLVDRHDYHLFTPNLYEIATAEEEFTSINQLKKSAAVPLAELLAGKRINFVRGELLSINQLAKKIKVGLKEFSYDYLILALGSVTDFKGIPGAAEYALPLGSLPEALRIRNATEFAVQSHCLAASSEVIRFAIAGGGCSSLEFAAEQKGLLDIAAWKYGYPREKLEIVLLEAGHRLLPDFLLRDAKDAQFRLAELGIRVDLGKQIIRVDKNQVEFSNGERMIYDMLIWSAGTKAALTPFVYRPTLDPKGRLVVNDHLHLEDFHNIFALGDLAALPKEKHSQGIKRALRQAQYLSYALPRFIKNQRPKPFYPRSSGYVLNLGGKWSLARINQTYLKGFMAYWAGQMTYFNYYRKVCGFKRAIRYFWLQRELYGRND